MYESDIFLWNFKSILFYSDMKISELLGIKVSPQVPDSI